MGADSRLDPVRWRRPGRLTLLRLAAMAALLVTATVVAWSGTMRGDPEHGDSAGLSSARHPRDPRHSAAQAGPAASTTAQPRSDAGSATSHSVPSTPSAPGDTRPGGPAAQQAGRPAVPPGSVGGPARLAVPPGSVGVPVRLAEPAALALLRPGDRVTLLRVEDTGGPTTVSDSALVLAVTSADDPTSGGLLVALNQAEAERAVVSTGRGFAVLLRPD